MCVVNVGVVIRKTILARLVVVSVVEIDGTSLLLDSTVTLPRSMHTCSKGAKTVKMAHFTNTHSLDGLYVY